MLESTKYEYKTQAVEVASVLDLEVILNQWGELGWECFHLEEYQLELSYVFHLYFKKPILNIDLKDFSYIKAKMEKEKDDDLNNEEDVFSLKKVKNFEFDKDNKILKGK